MSVRDDDVQDALVDTYRALRAMNEAARAAPVSQPVKGAGVDPRKVCKPGKRLRNWHRYHRNGILAAMSLREYARHMATNHAGPDGVVAKRWLAGKAVRP